MLGEFRGPVQQPIGGTDLRRLVARAGQFSQMNDCETSWNLHSADVSLAWCPDLGSDLRERAREW